MAFVSAPVQVYIQRPNVSLRGTTFQTRIHTTQCGSCDFVGNVKYDVFLHNIRIHRKCIICAEECFTKKGIMDHLATVHDEKVNCDMCDFQVSFPDFQLLPLQTQFIKKKMVKNCLYFIIYGYAFFPHTLTPFSALKGRNTNLNIYGPVCTLVTVTHSLTNVCVCLVSFKIKLIELTY